MLLHSLHSNAICSLVSLWCQKKKKKKTALESVHGSERICMELIFSFNGLSHSDHIYQTPRTTKNTMEILQLEHYIPSVLKWYTSFVWQTDQHLSHYSLALSFKSNMVHQVWHQWHLVMTQMRTNVIWCHWCAVWCIRAIFVCSSTKAIVWLQKYRTVVGGRSFMDVDPTHHL